jgi:hypothetical protein
MSLLNPMFMTVYIKANFCRISDYTSIIVKLNKVKKKKKNSIFFVSSRV